MAAPTIDDLKKQIEELKKVYKQLTGKPVTIVDASTIKGIQDAQNAIGILTDAIDTASDRTSKFGDGFVDIQKEIQEIIKELDKSNNAQKLATKALKGTQDIVQKLKYDQQDLGKLTLKELEKYKEKLKQQETEAKHQAQQLITNNQLNYATDAVFEIAVKRKLEAKKINEEEAAIIRGQREGFTVYKRTNDLLDSRIQKEKDINKLMGVGGAAIEGIDKALEEIGFGALSKALGIEEVKERMKEVAEEIQEAGGNTDSFANKMKVLNSGIGKAGKNVISTLKDPLTITLFVVTELVEAMKDVDAGAGKAAKNFGISYHSALELKGEMNQIAGSSLDVNLTTGKLVESFSTLNNALGTFADISEESLITFTKLTKQAGLSNEATIALYKNSKLNGKELEDTTAEYLGQVEAFKAQTGSAINIREVLEDIGKISAATSLTLGNTPEALAEAASQARALGMSLEQVEQSASALLQFESSIQSELEAELLTGKDLNLEKARQYALEGKLVEFAKEISSQFGDAADFTKMNVLQQEALAKSVGMTREALAKTLIDQEVLSKLKAKDGESAQEAFNNLVKTVGLEKAKKQLGKDALADQFAGQNIQERFAATMEKVKEVFISLAEPLLPVLEIFTDIFKILGPVIGLISKVVGFTATWGRYLLIPLGILKSFQLVMTGIAATQAFINGLTLKDNALKSTGNVLLTVGNFLTAGIFSTKTKQSALDTIALMKMEGLVGLEGTKLALQQESLGVQIRVYAIKLKEWAGTKISLIWEGIKSAFKTKEIAQEAVIVAEKAAGAAIGRKSLMLSIGDSISSAAGAVMKSPIGQFLGPFALPIALAVAASIGALGYKFLSGNDVMSQGYGKRTLLAGKDAIALNDEDTVLAGTDLGGKKKNKEEKGFFESLGDALTPTVNIDLSPLIERLTALETQLVALNSKNYDVYIDTTKLGTGVAIGTSKVQ